MRICIAGATGVLGVNTVPLLLERGYRVRALVRSLDKGRALLPPETELVECDLLAGDLALLLPGMMRGCDAVVHAATAIPADFSAPGAWDATAELRTTATRALIDAAVMSGVGIYIQQSIVMAYPAMGDEWIDERTPLDTAPERAAICGPVIAMEEMVREIPVERTRWTILRGGMFVGPGTMQQRRIEAIRAGTARVPGDGMNFLPLVHVAAMADAVVAAVRYGLAGATLNIVDDPLREGEYCDRLADLVGAPHPPRDPSLPRPPSWRCTNDAARALLGWEPRQGVVG